MAVSDLKVLGFPSGFRKMKLVQLLTERYPAHKWDKVYLLKGRYAQQKRLERAVVSLFPVSEACLLPLLMYIIIIGTPRDYQCEESYRHR